MRGARDGGGKDEPDPVEGFVRREFPALAGYCCSLVGDRDAAQDLAQEALVRTWGRWSTVREPRPYAYRVATNLAVRRLRETGRSSSLDAAASSAGISQPLSAAPSAERTVELRDLVDRLPDRLRAVVLLHYYADLPLDQIATAMHRPLGTVKRWLHEARGQLGSSWQET
jgi:RNA polymerase sigma-70 factor, ECF subfamily